MAKGAVIDIRKFLVHLLSVVSSLTCRLRSVNSQLVGLSPVRVLNRLYFLCNFCLFICSVHKQTTKKS